MAGIGPIRADDDEDHRTDNTQTYFQASLSANGCVCFYVILLVIVESFFFLPNRVMIHLPRLQRLRHSRIRKQEFNVGFFSFCCPQKIGAIVRFPTGDVLLFSANALVLHYCIDFFSFRVFFGGLAFARARICRIWWVSYAWMVNPSFFLLETNDFSLKNDGNLECPNGTQLFFCVGLDQKDGIGFLCCVFTVRTHNFDTTSTSMTHINSIHFQRTTHEKNKLDHLTHLLFAICDILDPIPIIFFFHER